MANGNQHVVNTGHVLKKKGQKMNVVWGLGATSAASVVDIVRAAKETLSILFYPLKQ